MANWILTISNALICRQYTALNPGRNCFHGNMFKSFMEDQFGTLRRSEIGFDAHIITRGEGVG
jgi:hypothetical protein